MLVSFWSTLGCGYSCYPYQKVDHFKMCFGWRVSVKRVLLQKYSSGFYVKFQLQWIKGIKGVFCESQDCSQVTL